MVLRPAINKSSCTENTRNSRGVRYVCCKCYEKNGGHLHIRMGTGKADPGCTAMHLGDTETMLLHFAKLIKMVAYSENNIIKKNLLQDLVPCIENFNLDSSSALSSKLPSLFVANTILKIKKLIFPNNNLYKNPKNVKNLENHLPLKF